MPIRKGARRVKVYNSGLIVFLYDNANAPTLKNSQAAILQGYSESVAKDAKLLSLTAKGLLVAYELRQDDGLDLEVVVGPPLTRKELESSRWLEPQQARLSLPSGKLCIESYDALRLGTDKPLDKGAMVTVPKGDYLLTLYRVHWDQLEAEGTDYKGPEEVVVLTPARQAAPPKDHLGVLPWVDKPVVYPWLGRYQIDHGVFDGLVVDCESSVLTLNFDQKAAGQLDLHYGQALDIQCGKSKFSAVFLENEPHALFIEKYGADRLKGHPGAWWTPDHSAFAPPQKVLHVAVPEKTRLRSGTGATITVGPEPVLRLEELDFERGAESGTEAAGKIIDVYLWGGFLPSFRTNIDAPALEAMGAKPGAKLTLHCGGVQCPFELFATPLDRDMGIGKASRLADPKLNSKLHELVSDYCVLLLDQKFKPSPALPKKKAALWNKIDKLRRTGLAVIPTCGCLVPDPHDSKRVVLEVQPLRALVGIHEMHPAFDFTPERGAEVRLKKNP